MSIILILPFIVIALELFVIYPSALYGAGKIMKITNPKFKFTTCIWINFIAGLLAELVSGIHPILTIIVFIGLLSFMIKKQFEASTNAIIVMILFTFIAAVIVTLAKPYLILQLLNIL